jgi:hypothetical protein
MPTVEAETEGASNASKTPAERPYTLFGWELDWLTSHCEGDAALVVRRYLRARTRRNGPDSSKSPEVRIRRLLEENSSYIESELSAELLEAALSIPVGQSSELFEAFRDLWRGFTDAELATELRWIAQRIRETRQTLLREKQRTVRQRLQAARIGHQGKTRLYDRALADFASVDADLLALVPEQLAEAGLRRRRPGPWANWFGLLLPPDPLDMVRMRLAMRETARASMPLRFLVGQPYSTWLELHRAWSAGTERTELLAQLESVTQAESVIADIARLHSTCVSRGLPARTSAIGELTAT